MNLDVLNFLRQHLEDEKRRRKLNGNSSDEVKRNYESSDRHVPELSKRDSREKEEGEVSRYYKERRKNNHHTKSKKKHENRDKKDRKIVRINTINTPSETKPQNMETGPLVMNNEYPFATMSLPLPQEPIHSESAKSTYAIPNEWKNEQFPNFPPQEPIQNEILFQDRGSSVLKYFQTEHDYFEYPTPSLTSYSKPVTQKVSGFSSAHSLNKLVQLTEMQKQDEEELDHISRYQDPYEYQSHSRTQCSNWEDEENPLESSFTQFETFSSYDLKRGRTNTESKQDVYEKERSREREFERNRSSMKKNEERNHHEIEKERKQEKEKEKEEKKKEEKKERMEEEEKKPLESLTSQKLTPLEALLAPTLRPAEEPTFSTFKTNSTTNFLSILTQPTLEEKQKSTELPSKAEEPLQNPKNAGNVLDDILNRHTNKQSNTTSTQSLKHKTKPTQATKQKAKVINPQHTNPATQSNSISFPQPALFLKSFSFSSSNALAQSSSLSHIPSSFSKSASASSALYVIPPQIMQFKNISKINCVLDLDLTLVHALPIEGSNQNTLLPAFLPQHRQFIQQFDYGEDMLSFFFILVF